MNSRILVEPEHPVIARCAFQHEWETSLRVERDKFQTKRQGKRPFHQYHYIYAIDLCPTCGQRQAGSVPVRGICDRNEASQNNPHGKDEHCVNWRVTSGSAQGKREIPINIRAWSLVELVARGNTETSILEAMAEELMEARCQAMHEDEGEWARRTR